MSNQKTISPMTAVQWIDYTLMTFLSLFGLAYISHSGKNFAEIHYQFPFLNFPVFIGEFLLAGCGLLFLIRTYLSGIRWNRWWVLIMVYIGFFVIKAAVGYCKYGPLALRHAALFYYVFFAVIAYYCYRPEFFRWWMILIYVGALHWLFFSGQFYDWWLMPRIFIGLMLACAFPNRRVGWLIAASVLLLSPYQYFLDTSRSIIVANFLSVSFLIVTASLIFGNKRIAVLGSVLIVGLFGVYVFCLSGNKYAQGLVAFDRLNYLYEEVDAMIQQRKDSFQEMEIPTVALYSPEQPAPKPDSVSKQPATGSVGSFEGVADQTMVGEGELIAPSSSASSSENPPAVQPADSSTEPDPQKDMNDHIRDMKLGNSVFRLLIWKDAKKELLEQRPLLGFDFGKPFRSRSVEAVHWGMDIWMRDGWIAMHNSYLEVVYRAGILGISMLFGMLAVFTYCSVVFIRHRSMVGLLICACLIVPLAAAGFSVSLELPHTAIPIWTLFGLVVAYAHSRLKIHPNLTDLQRI